MRVAVYHNNDDIRIEDRPIPEIGPDEILVRVHASGICGSDVMEWYRLRKAPLVLGHEIAGSIERAGAGVVGFAAGDRVFVSHHVPCMGCRYCDAGQHTLCDTLRSTDFEPGGFAEFIRVPAINVRTGTFLLPEGMSFEEGVFIEPLACVLRGIRIARFTEGSSALVLGSGISGLLFIRALRAAGASKIAATDISDFRVKTAERFGADIFLKADEALPDRLGRLNGGARFDLVIVCAGSPSVAEQAFRFVARGGTVLLFAPLEPGETVTLPLFDIWHDQITIVSTYAGAPADIERAIGSISRGEIRVTDMITHRLPLEETARGFGLVQEARESIKVIIVP